MPTTLQKANKAERQALTLVPLPALRRLMLSTSSIRTSLSDVISSMAPLSFAFNGLVNGIFRLISSSPLLDTCVSFFMSPAHSPPLKNPPTHAPSFGYWLGFLWPFLLQPPPFPCSLVTPIACQWGNTARGSPPACSYPWHLQVFLSRGIWQLWLYV